MLQQLMQKTGGMRGVLAAAAIAWGVGQAQAILTETTETRDGLADEMAKLAEARDGLQAELDALEATRDLTLERMRAVVLAEIALDVHEGKHDGVVKLRAAALGWTAPASAAGAGTGQRVEWCGGGGLVGKKGHAAHEWRWSTDGDGFDRWCDGNPPSHVNAQNADEEQAEQLHTTYPDKDAPVPPLTGGIEIGGTLYAAPAAARILKDAADIAAEQDAMREHEPKYAECGEEFPCSHAPDGGNHPKTAAKTGAKAAGKP